MGSRSRLVGMEVPIIGSDSVKWLQVSVPSTTATINTPALPPPQHEAAATTLPTADVASYSIIGNPPTYLIWRIHKVQPNVVEIMELCSYKEFPRAGLQILFPDALLPFAFICKDEINLASGNLYILYALTVSGVAYLIRLKNFHDYASCSVFPSHEVIEYNTQSHSHCGGITSVAAAPGYLVVGRNDGSVATFQLGMLDPSAPDFVHELRDDVGFGRLWGIVSRSRMVAAVQDLVIAEVFGKKLLFVLHVDGILRVWDLLYCNRIFSNSMHTETLTGTTVLRLWVGETDNSTSTIPLAILCRRNLVDCMADIYVNCIRYIMGDKFALSLEPSMQHIPLEEGALVDVKLGSNKIWTLKEDGLVMHDLFGSNTSGFRELQQHYATHEASVGDQLFQNSEHSSDELLWLAHSVFSSLKDQVAPFVSSIFLHRLLLPGVHHCTVLRATLQDYNRHLTDSEFLSLTVDGLRREILSLIEHEGFSESPVAIVSWWKTFCARYFHNWCRNNAACGLLVDSSVGAIGLIRSSSFSLFRCLENIELLTFGSFDELGDILSSELEFSDDDLEREILFEVLHCITNVNQQLGKAASAILYESLLSGSSISCEEVVPHLLKVLETGYSSSIAALQIADLGADTVWEKEVANHKNLRKFSSDMFLSLHALRGKATEWKMVLNVIEKYLKFVVPRKIMHKFDSESIMNINTSITVHATSQVAKVMLESALDILLLLRYLIDISAQIHLSYDDVSRIQLELVPMIQEIVTEWHIVYYLGTTPSESPDIEDFSSQLSSLQIDSNMGKRSWNEKLGKFDFTLAYVLLLNIQSSSEDQSHLPLGNLPDPSSIICSVRDFSSWIIWGRTGEESSVFFSHSIQLALILLRHGQYGAVEYLLTMVEAHSRKEKISGSLQSPEWCTLIHLLGCCLLAQARRAPHMMLKERKVSEAARCFFRAASVQEAPQALQKFPYEAGLAHLGFTDCFSEALWKFRYYQWAMQIFEQYSMSEAACQFALAALEQVDEALGPNDGSSGVDPLNESSTAVKGRLWANVFKFNLDLSNYYDAYCAIISNPDEESKIICLRRFIIVLYDRGAVKILCDGQLPFIGLSEKVERELAWKAERSDVSSKPSPFKLLYAFEMNMNNWRKAASYIYLYAAKLRTKAATRDNQRRSMILQERLNGLSAAINALHLVYPAYAWIDTTSEDSSLHDGCYPSKKPRIAAQEQSRGDAAGQVLQTYVDVEKLENEFVLTTAEYLLSLESVTWTFTGTEKPPAGLVDLLVQSSLYDMAFTVLMKFWKGSGLNRELERVFVAMSVKCCPSSTGVSSSGNDHRTHALALTSKDDVVVQGSLDLGPSAQQSMRNSHWGTLELYLEKYRGLHQRLPVIVAETLLSSDPQIELPLWLVRMFKDTQRESHWGMAGSEASPASLLRLYVDYGRFAEATNLVLEYMESFASGRPVDIIRRKKPMAVWFPYTTIERLWCQLEESIRLGHKADQCEKLKKLLHGTLIDHLTQLKVDSEDAISSMD